MDLKIFLIWLKLLLFCAPLVYHITSETKRVEGLKTKLTSDTVRVGVLYPLVDFWTGLEETFRMITPTDPYWWTPGLD